MSDQSHGRGSLPALPKARNAKGNAVAKSPDPNNTVRMTKSDGRAAAAQHPHQFSTLSLRRAAPAVGLVLAGFVGWQLPTVLADRDEIDIPTTQAPEKVALTKPEINPTPAPDATLPSQAVAVVPSYQTGAPATVTTPAADPSSAPSALNNVGGDLAPVGANQLAKRPVPQLHTHAQPPTTHVTPHPAHAEPRVVVVAPPEPTIHPRFYPAWRSFWRQPYVMGRPFMGRSFGGGFHGGHR